MAHSLIDQNKKKMINKRVNRSKKENKVGAVTTANNFSYSPSVLKTKRKFHDQWFNTRITRFWNTILRDCSPYDYNMALFKSNVNKFLLSRLLKLTNTTQVSPLSMYTALSHWSPAPHKALYLTMLPWALIKPKIDLTTETGQQNRPNP